ncbi:hypothetical protein [Sphingomonas solaris]|uniref:Uncharacterized protein n=1 Tax=Alterirhizorhabdus solaris TaxID=2529389 RepID=A0A558QUT0_9SPHN|nr:hypothetical protein [Sphingomonas solaris]TVV70906.1 hypothetical protein FOY91_18035 [Sphingomonas solaris]
MPSDTTESSIASAATSAIDVGVKVSEIALASGVVVGARLWLIGAALRNPFSGDYRELGRMVPEKVFALAQSGIALVDRIGAAQRDMMAQMVDSENLIVGGVPTPATLVKLATETGKRGTRAMMWPLTTSDAALAPVHRTVTSNARRLGNAARKAA